MQEYNKEPGASALSNSSNTSTKPPDGDDEVRRFLARCTVLLVVLNLIVYLITRDIGVLAGTTVVGIAVYAVFRYYFSPRNGSGS
jgi:hypothetical protein